jgi:acetylornithine/succinyldiaminopimelate/putrescine aminotransferase
MLSATEPTELTRISEETPALFWERGKGNRVWDVDGKCFLDFTSAFGVSILGHAPEVVLEAIERQARMLVHSMGEVFPSRARLQLCQKVLNLSGYGPSGYKCSITQSGSEAIELALKALLLRHPGARLVACTPSFHGQLLGALSVTGQQELREPFDWLLRAGVTFLPYPENEFLANALLGEVDEMLSVAHARVILVLEPMGNANGGLAPPASFWEAVRKLRREHGLVLLLDEIYTGFARSGAWLLHREYAIEADAVCVGKAMTGGLPIAACVASADTWAGLRSPSFLPLHGSTYSAHPLSVAGAVAAIDELVRIDAPSLAIELGFAVEQALRRTIQSADCSALLRGRGLMWVLEFGERNEAGRATAQSVSRELLRRGYIVLQTGLPSGNCVGMAPPLCVTREEIDSFAEALREVLEMVRP